MLYAESIRVQCSRDCTRTSTGTHVRGSSPDMFDYGRTAWSAPNDLRAVRPAESSFKQRSGLKEDEASYCSRRTARMSAVARLSSVARSKTGSEPFCLITRQQARFLYGGWIHRHNCIRFPPERFFSPPQYGADSTRHL